MNKELKYEYGLHAWGGFWNDHNIRQHKIKEFRYKWFDTEEERTRYIKYLKEQEKKQGNRLLAQGKYNDSCIVMSLFEGYNSRIETVLHRVVKVIETGELVYSSNNLGYGFNNYSVCQYILEWKWSPGCNDWAVLEDDTPEELSKIEIIDEWITGSFDDKKEKYLGDYL